MSTRELRQLGRRIGLAEAGARPPGASAALDEAAGRAGLADVGYGFVDGPLGRLLVAVTGRGVARVAFPTEDVEEVLLDLSATVSPRILESPRLTERARRELDEYFEGRRRAFEVAVDLSAVRGFHRRVLAVTAEIPFGSVRSYSEVAALAGSPRGARAAGNALRTNPVPVVVPCHRVLHADGTIGGYAGRPERKVLLLRLEGALPHGSPDGPPEGPPERPPERPPAGPPR